MTATEIRLASRPKGWPTLDNFETASVDLPAVTDGHVLVRNQFMSVDPYMRGRMNDVKSYAPPVQIGEVMVGGTVCRVEQSNDPVLQPGDIVDVLGFPKFGSATPVLEDATFLKLGTTNPPLPVALDNLTNAFDHEADLVAMEATLTGLAPMQEGLSLTLENSGDAIA